MTCKYFHKGAYSDSIWRHLYRESWPEQTPAFASPASGVREAYIQRRTDLLQFKFSDPLVADFVTDTMPVVHNLLNKKNIIFSKGFVIKVVNIDDWLSGRDSVVTLSNHSARITCMNHKTSILVTATGDSKVRLWDAAAQSALPFSSCVGMASIPGPLVNMKCHEQLLYLAASPSVAIIDVRTEDNAKSSPIFYRQKLYSFEAIPSKSLFCVGTSHGRAMLYDIRRVNLPNSKAEPVTKLFGGQIGPLTHLHMDPYTIVTGGPSWCARVNVWVSNTGALSVP